MTLTKAVKQNKKYNLIILDGKNLSFKYFYGMKNLTNKEGEKTGLYHGFLSVVLKLKLKYPKARVVVAWEGGKLVRNEAMKEYKANRQASDGDLTVSIKKLKRMLGMIGIEQKYSLGYEADDVAATLCNDFKGEILLVSNDGDWMQMMNLNCNIMIKNNIISYEKLRKVVGFNPEKVIIYDAIKGGHNNLKGIPLFPVALAKKIARKSMYINDIYNFVPKTKQEGKWRDVLRVSRNFVTSNYETMKLKTNTKLKDLSCPKRNLKQLKSLLKKSQLRQVTSLLEKTEN